MLLFDIFATCITKVGIGVISALLLCHFLENLGCFVLFFVFTDVSKVEDVLLSALEGFFVDVVDGSLQFGDGAGGGSKRGARSDGDSKLLHTVNNTSNRKAPSESGFQLAPYGVVELQVVKLLSP